MSRADRLVVPGSVLEAMVRHALEALPLEAVGLLGGTPGGEVKRHCALPNLLGPRQFLADPYAQYRALRQLEAEGLSSLAVYHSHPDGGVDLSASDVASARRLPYLQVVIALAGADVRVAAWAVAGAGARPATIEVVDDGGLASFSVVSPDRNASEDGDPAMLRPTSPDDAPPRRWTDRS